MTTNPSLTAPATKADYLNRLSVGIAQLPGTEILKSLSFYEEMIDDRIEDGMSEAEAVASLESPEQAAATILDDMPVVPRAVAKTRRLSEPLFWTLLVLGSPIWLSLGIAFVAVAFSGYLVIWAFALAVWALAIGLMAGGPVGIGVAIWGLMHGQPLYAMFELSVGLLCLGAGLLLLQVAMASSSFFADLSRRWAAKAAGVFRRVRRGESDPEPGFVQFQGRPAPADGQIVDLTRRYTERNRRIWRTVHIVAAITMAVGALGAIVAGALGGWDPNLIMLMA